MKNNSSLKQTKQMKSLRLIAFSAIVTIGTFSAVLYSSCNKTSDNKTSDPCSGITCNHGGVCSSGTCTCPTGYMGTNCQTLALIGSWKGNDACSVGGPYNNIIISVASSSTDTTKVLITNPGGFGSSVQITGNLSTDGKTVTYTNQAVSSAVTISGTITLTSNTAFTHAYTAIDASTTTTCSGNYDKQ